MPGVILVITPVGIFFRFIVREVYSTKGPPLQIGEAASRWQVIRAEWKAAPHESPPAGGGGGP
jgi:hypothetical protein